MKVLVAGMVNVETSVPVPGFPLPYEPTRFVSGVRSVVSGVGWNVALAMHTLGSDVHFLGFRAADAAGRAVDEAIAASGVPATLLPCERTPQSAILGDGEGRRAIFADLAGVQGSRAPAAAFARAVAGRGLAILANVDWTRPLLRPTRAQGIPVVTDLHDVVSLDNPYDTDYLETADVVFLSDERLSADPGKVSGAILRRHGPELVVVGLGSKGALLHIRGEAPVRVPAPRLRPVGATTGAGDALLAAFCHFRYTRGWDPPLSLRAAVTFASWKVGDPAGSEGFLDEPGVLRLLEPPG